MNSKKKATQKAEAKRWQCIAVFGTTLAAVAAAKAVSLSQAVPVPKHTSVLTG